VLSGLVSHYRVVSTLGAGGMGVVHKAIDTRLNRPVAIKAIPEGLGLDTAAVLRLRAEAQSAASLDHPYICKIYELLDTDAGTLIVMEFVEGETLASMLLREGPLPVPTVMRYAAEIAEGLAAAHATGLIHRDVKPSNVMITPHNHVKLLDFGIAHNPATASGTVTTQSMQTRPGSVAGSPFYMAPEHALGRTVDGRTDVFSLGAVLFECLTGKLPFEGTTRDAYVVDMLTGRPRSVATFDPSVPATIVDVVANCLERNPELRPDAASVAAYLRAEAPTGSTDRFFIPPRRSWKRLALTALAFLALAVPAAWGVYRWLVPVESPTLGKQEALIT
jgi:eukaryotic-like serine/threonine-protein kinase